jgi:cyclase
MIASTALALALCAAPGPTAHACPAHFQKVSPTPVVLEVEALGGGCFRLAHSAANIGVYMGWEGILLVDTGFLQDAPEVEEKLMELWEAWWRESVAGLRAEAEAEGREPLVPARPEGLPVRYVVSTHFHIDHVQANGYFGLAGGIGIAHESVRRRMTADPTITDEKVMDPPMEPEGLPAITFESSITLHFNGGPIEIFHLPMAHTDGDCVVWIPRAHVLFAGDVFNSRSFPYIELTVGARPRHMVSAHEFLLSFVPADAWVVPGHGGAAGVDLLQEFAAMIADCDRQTRIALEQGKSQLALYDQRFFGEYEDRWAFGKAAITKGFIDIMWFCYAPTRLRGLGELDRLREEEAARGGQ